MTIKSVVAVGAIVLGAVAFPACGGSQRVPTVTVGCLAPEGLAEKVRDWLLEDGGPYTLTVSDRLLGAMEALAVQHGVDSLRCAVDAAEGLLLEHEAEIREATRVESEGQRAVMARHADLVRLMGE